MRPTAWHALTLSFVALASGCVPADPCLEWIGTWRGAFTGHVEGQAFDLAGMQFQLQVVTDGEYPVVSISETNWQLAPGYSMSVEGAGFECTSPQLDLTRSFCVVRGPAGTDNCEFIGALFREGDGSGSFKAPSATDRSPTYDATGSWTLSH